MNPEEFIRKYEDTHTELSVIDKLASSGSLIEKHPEDKNITVKGVIPGKHLIESRATEKRAEGLLHCLFDACSARIPDLMEMPIDKLVALTIKASPQKIDQKIEHEFTFADMVKKASLEVENYETIDEEQPEV